ncbi:MAG: hypothetical protein K6A72_08200 [Lachnospiraceae bacterium]|nr:hypothetical protein [Lachnospiraceae bacterium]
MIYESEKAKYEVLSTVLSTEDFDVLICAEVSEEKGSKYTVFLVRSHELIKRLLIMLDANSTPDGSTDVMIESFSTGKDHFFVFPYRQERAIDKFFVGEGMSINQCETICCNVILACITSGLPYPLLYLILKHRLVNLSRDDSIYLSYCVDLSEMDEKIGEKECVVCCAEIITDLLERASFEKAISYQILQKKGANKSYTQFIELYRDVRIASAPEGKIGIFKQIKKFFSRHSDTFFRILFVLCSIVAVIALVMLLSNLLFGDQPWLRIFYNNFKVIGTQSLE